MRIVMGLAIMLLLTTPISASPPLAKGDALIIPGHRIGPVHLGMSRNSVDALNLNVACPVSATYDTQDRAVRLVTNTGGACSVTDEIQVGLGGSPILTTFGLPDEVKEDVRYPQATAYWLNYIGWGIGFRILVMRDRSSFIQAITVFQGTASSTARPCPLLVCSEPTATHW